MAVDVYSEALIGRPRGEVAAFASDPDNVCAWYANIRSVEWETPPPLALGTRLRFAAEFMGRKLAYTYEVREMMAGERFVMATADGPFPMETTYTWADAPGGGTLMGLRNRGEPTGFARVASPVMAAAVGRANRKDLERLRAILEQQGPAAA